MLANKVINNSSVCLSDSEAMCSLQGVASNSEERRNERKKVI